MTMRARKWWLSIVLAFLLVHSSSGTTEEDPYKNYAAAGDVNEKYEVIDVGHEKNGNSNSQQSTGQTTHVYVNGEVDDDFWLKHLGDDFKHAIHLQVGGQHQYDRSSNASDDSTRYEVHYPYAQNGNPMEYTNESYYPSVRNGTTNFEFKQTGINSYEETLQNSADNQFLDGAEIIDKDEEQTPAANKTTDNNNESNNTNQQEKSFEHIYSMDDNDDDALKIASRFYNPNSFNLFGDSQKDGYNKYQAKDNYKNYKHSDTNTYTNTYTNTNTNTNTNPNTNTDTNKDTNTNTNTNRNLFKNEHKFSPIMVNLPENQKSVVQLNENEEPVVVKMAPVIYHQFGQENTNTHKHATQQKHTKERHYTAVRFQPRQLRTHLAQTPNFKDLPSPFEAASFESKAIFQSPTAAQQQDGKPTANHFRSTEHNQQRWRSTT